RQFSNDVLDDAIAEILLFRITAHINEGQHGDRWPVGKRQSRLQGLRFRVEPHPANPHRPGDILQPLLAQIVEGDVELAARILLNPAGDADATRLRESLQTCRHVHTVAIDVAGLDHDVADIDAEAKLDPLLRWDTGTALSHAALDLDSAAQGIDHARELRQQTVPSGLHNPPTMFGNLPIDEVPP